MIFLRKVTWLFLFLKYNDRLVENKDFLTYLSVEGKSISSFNSVNEEIPSLLILLLSQNVLLESLPRYAARRPSDIRKKLGENAMVA